MVSRHSTLMLINFVCRVFYWMFVHSGRDDWLQDSNRNENFNSIFHNENSMQGKNQRKKQCMVEKTKVEKMVGWYSFDLGAYRCLHRKSFTISIRFSEIVFERQRHETTKITFNPPCTKVQNTPTSVYIRAHAWLCMCLYTTHNSCVSVLSIFIQFFFIPFHVYFPQLRLVEYIWFDFISVIL